MSFLILEKCEYDGRGMMLLLTFTNKQLFLNMYIIVMHKQFELFFHKSKDFLRIGSGQQRIRS